MVDVKVSGYIVHDGKLQEDGAVIQLPEEHAQRLVELGKGEILKPAKKPAKEK